MAKKNTIIIGCGDVGKRIAQQLVAEHQDTQAIAWVQSQKSRLACQDLTLKTDCIDLDSADFTLASVHSAQELKQAHVYYLVPPNKEGQVDQRSRCLINALSSYQAEHGTKPAKLVLISTTGVYGDCDGDWVTEQTPANPTTDRAKRRLDSETQWRAWCAENKVLMNILRVPGIYANSRIPVDRIRSLTPVVRANECGYTNRIHADDLAMIAIAAMHTLKASSITKPSDHDNVFNATDGSPSKISEYLQEAAKVMGLPALPEISMAEAQQQLSQGMLSYLSESRKISNEKMLQELKVTLRYPDFRVGLRH